MEKLILALVTAARKLRPYFQAHTIEVPTKFSMKQVLHKPETSGRLMKWACHAPDPGPTRLADPNRFPGR